MPAMLEALRAFFEKYKNPAIVVGSVVGALVIGLIIAAAMGVFVPATLPAFAEKFVLQPILMSILSEDGSYDYENDVGAAGSYTRLASLDSYTQTPASGEEFRVYVHIMVYPSTRRGVRCCGSIFAIERPHVQVAGLAGQPN